MRTSEHHKGAPWPGPSCATGNTSPSLGRIITTTDCNSLAPTYTAKMQKWLSLALALAAPSQAYLRFGCGTLVVQRLDPIVEPGVVPSAHVHQIVGGNSFNASMNPKDFDPGEKATCTTCSFSEDLSNYWTAVLYFKAKNGTYKRVPQYPNALLGDLKGGMTIYYLQNDFNTNGNQKITAFKTVSRPRRREA